MDDLFVRDDILKTKYTNVDFEAAEKFSDWCGHFTDARQNYHEYYLNGCLDLSTEIK